MWCVCFVKSVWVETMAWKYVLLGMGVSIAAIAVMVGVSVLSQFYELIDCVNGQLMGLDGQLYNILYFTALQYAGVFLMSVCLLSLIHI